MVEKKVTWATLAALVAGIGAAILNGVVADNSMMGSLPAWLQALILLAAPTILVFLSGYEAPHTDRPDLVPAQLPSTPPPLEP